MPLIKECLRWCSPTRVVGTSVDSESFTAEERLIDWFVDKHLYYLPFPRFTRLYNEVSTLEDLVDNVCLSLMGFAHDCDTEIESEICSTQDLYQIAEKFKSLCPTLPTLRQRNFPLTNLQCALALVALDPIEFSKISANTLHYEIFPQLAIKMASREIGHDTSVQTLLHDVDAFLETQKLDEIYNSLPSADDWPNKILWITARDNMMVAVPDLEPFCLVTGVSLESLQKCAYVKNIVDEDIQVGFLRADIKEIM